LTVEIVCSALELSRSSFYAAAKAKHKNDQLDNEVWGKITKLWKKLPGLGYPKLAEYLSINGKKILRILQKKRGKTAQSKKQSKPDRKFPNLLIQITDELDKHPEKLARGDWILKEGKNGYRKLIEPTRPYQLWAADWKEFAIPYLGITIYIFAIIDVYTRQLKGYSFSLIKDAQSALKAARMAIKNSKDDPLFNPKRLIIHSDQGGAYLAEIYIELWKKMGTSISMSDPGKPTQNPYIEAFFSIQSRFWLSHFEYDSAIELEKSLKKFFRLYNREWKHTGIQKMTPDEFLEIYRRRINHTSKT
jgi:transposase InsO family protein